MRLLALDLSSNVGHARLVRGAEPRPPRFGTLTLGGGLERKIGAFQIWLEDQYMVDPFDALAWERPLLLPTDNVNLLELLYGLVGICYGFVHKQKLAWREVSVEQVKITLTGNARATKREMVYAAMNVANWVVHNDHEADAGAVGVWAYEQIWPTARAA